MDPRKGRIPEHREGECICSCMCIYIYIHIIYIYIYIYIYNIYIYIYIYIFPSMYITTLQHYIILLGLCAIPSCGDFMLWPPFALRHEGSILGTIDVDVKFQLATAGLPMTWRPCCGSSIWFELLWRCHACMSLHSVTKSSWIAVNCIHLDHGRMERTALLTLTH